MIGSLLAEEIEAEWPPAMLAYEVALIGARK